MHSYGLTSSVAAGFGIRRLFDRRNPGWVKYLGSGSGMNNPDHISESLETVFSVKILKFFDAVPGSGMEKIWIRDGKNLDPGSGINIPNPQHCLQAISTIKRHIFLFRKLLLTVPALVWVKSTLQRLSRKGSLL